MHACMNGDVRRRRGEQERKREKEERREKERRKEKKNEEERKGREEKEGVSRSEQTRAAKNLELHYKSSVSSYSGSFHA